MYIIFYFYFSEWKGTNKMYIQCSACGDNVSMHFNHIENHANEKHGHIPHESENKPFVFHEITKAQHKNIVEKNRYKIKKLLPADENTKYKCNYCNKRLFKKNLEKHIIIHHEMPNKCDLCTEFRYYFDKDIIKHMQEVHNEVFKKYKCDLCDKIFVNNQSLKRY